MWTTADRRARDSAMAVALPNQAPNDSQPAQSPEQMPATAALSGAAQNPDGVPPGTAPLGGNPDDTAPLIEPGVLGPAHGQWASIVPFADVGSSAFVAIPPVDTIPGTGLSRIVTGVGAITTGMATATIQTSVSAGSPAALTGSAGPTPNAIILLDAGPVVTAAQIRSILLGLQGTLLGFESALSNSVLKMKLPLIGDGLGKAASILQSYESLETAITNTLASFQAAGATAAALQTALNAAIAPLGYGTNATTVALNGGTLSIAFAAGNSLASPGIGIDAKFGLPGLDLSALGAVNASVTTTAGYTLGLTASVDTNSTYQQLSGGKLTLSTDIEVPTLQAETSLGLLKFSATLNPNDPSYVRGAFTIPVSGNITFAGSANVDVHLATDLGAAAPVPAISADLAVKWPFSGGTIDPNNIAGFGDLPTAALNNVSIDFGTYLSNFLGPILSDMDTLITPLLPMVELFTTDLAFFKKIPGFDWTTLDTAGAVNAAGQVVGDGKVSLLDFMNQPTSGTSDTPVIVKVFSVLNEIHRLAGFFNGGNFGSAAYPIGSFAIPDIRAGGFDPTKTNPSQTAGNTAPNDSSISSFVGSLGGDFLGLDSSGESAIKDFQDLLNGSGFTFPLLNNPLSVAKLLLGNGATDLLTYRTPADFSLGIGTVDASGAPQSVPLITVPILPGVSVQIAGYLLAVLDLEFGLDTKGLEEFASGGFTDPPDTIAKTVLDGLYVDAPKLANGTPTLFDLDIGVGLTLVVGVPGTSVDGSGDVKGVVHVLPSQPGKNYLSTLLPILNGPDPLSAFTASGSVFADLEFTVKALEQQVFHLASDPLILAQFGDANQTDPSAPNYIPAAVWQFAGFGYGEVSGNWSPTYSAAQIPNPGNSGGTHTQLNYGDTTIDVHSGGAGLPDIGSDVVFDSLRAPYPADMTSLVLTAGNLLEVNGGVVTIDDSTKASTIAGTISVTATDIAGATLSLGGVLRNSGKIVAGTPGAAGGPGTSIESTIAVGGIVDLTGGGIVVSSGDAVWTGDPPYDQLDNIDNVIAGAGDFRAPILNQGTFDANAIGTMSFENTVLNSGLMRASGPLFDDLGAVRGRLAFEGVKVDNQGGTILADGGTVYFDNGTTIHGGQLLGRKPSVQVPVLITPIAASGTVTLDGGTSGLDIEALVEVTPQTFTLGGTGPSILTLTGLIDSQPYAASLGSSAIVSGNESVRLQSATIQGGELDAGAPATGPAGLISVIGSALLDGQSATQGVAINGIIDVHSAVLGIVGGIVPVSAGSGINLSDAATSVGQGALTPGTLVVGGGPSDAATLAPVPNGGPGQGVLVLAPDGKSSVSGKDAASTLTNSWLIEGDGLFGNGQLGLINTAAGVIEANSTAGRLIVNVGGSPSRNAGLIHAIAGGGMALAGVFNNAGGRIIADGGSIDIGILAGPATIQGGTLATAHGGTITLVTGATLDGVAAAVTIAAGALVVPGSSQTLTGTVVNQTTLALHGFSGVGFGETITLSGSTSLGGGGAITMEDASGLGASATQVITGANLGVLDNVDNRIVGYGSIGGSGPSAITLINEHAGTIDATGGTMILSVFGIGNKSSNRGLIEAVGGSLDLSGTIDNAGGTIRSANDGASHSGIALIDGLTIAGGLLSGDAADPASRIVTTTKNGTLDGTASPGTIANTGQVQVAHNTSLTLLGSIADQGTVSVIGLPGSLTTGDANVVISGTVNLTGSGSVLLSRGPTDVLHGNAIVAGKSVADRLNNGVTISGSGLLGAAALTIDNLAAGAVIAAGGTLVVNTDFRSGQAFIAGSAPVTNAGLLTSVTTGLLDLTSDVANTGGTIGASGGGITYLDNNIVSGGTFDGSGGGRILSSFSTIDATGFPVTLTSGARVGVQAGAPIAFAASDTLTLKGSFLNHGTLFVLHDSNTDQWGINISGSVTLGGGGQLQILDTLFSGAASAAFVQGDDHGTITSYSNNTLDNVDNLISGNGRLGNPSLRIVNEAAGIISSISGSTLLISTLSGNSLVTKGGVVNQGTMRALGGTLDLIADIDNRGGTIAALRDGAGHSGTVIIDGGSFVNGVIKGGTFTSDPGDPNSFIRSGAGTIDGSSGAVTLTAGAPLHIVPDSTLSATGTIVNLGTVVIFSNTLSGVSPALVAAGTLVMTGGGRVAMSFTGGAPDYIVGTTDADLLDNVDNTIIGFGRIGESRMSLLNEAAGTIAAQGGTLLARIDSTVNHGLLEAFGGTLQLIGTIANAGGTIAARNDGVGHSGTVLLAGATIQGGVLATDTTDPASVITFLGASGNLLDGTVNAVTLAAGSQLRLGPSQTAALTGAISSHGTIALAAAQSVAFNSTAKLLVAGTATISGGGLISLTDTSGLGGTHEQVVTGTVKTDTLDNVDNTIQGVGLLGNGFMRLINEAGGTIGASGGALIVNTGTAVVVNHGRMGAAAGGTLDIVSPVANTGGTIGGGGGIALIDNAGAVLGGTLNGEVDGTFGTIDGVANTVTVATGATLEALAKTLGLASASMILKGTIANQGTMLLRDDDAGLAFDADFTVSGTVALIGGGALNLTGGTAQDTGTGNRILGSALSDTLDNVNNTIAGFGRVGNGTMTLLNESAGTVSATGGTLTLYTGTAEIANKGLLTSGTGGVLDVLSAVKNAGGTIGADGGVTKLDQITVEGGSFASSHGGTILVPNNVTLDGSTGGIVLTPNAFLSVAANATLTLTGATAVHGTISNNGSIADGANFVLDGTLINNGSLSGGYTLTGAGALINAAGKRVPGAVTALAAGETIANLGTIAGAVSLAGGDRLVTGAGAVFAGGITGGTGGNTLEIATGPFTLTQFNAPGSPQYSTLQIDAGVTVTPDATDILTGVTLINHGKLNLTAFTAQSPVRNDGEIVGDVTLTGGVELINSAGGTITGDGLAVIEGNNGPASVVNSGVIDPAQYGVDLPAGGTVTNSAGGTIVGTVAGISISGGAGTVTNGGVISGGGGIDAVTLAAGFANRVILTPGAVFTGLVDGGNPAGGVVSSVLELGGDGGVTTLSGLGTQFLDFGTVAVDFGARALLTGQNSLTSGTTLTDAGALRLADGASLDQSGPGTVSGTAGIAGALTVDGAGSRWTVADAVVGDQGDGTVTISAGASLSTAGTALPPALVLGAGAGATGSVTVTGVGSQAKLAGQVNVGGAGTGSFQIFNQASVISGATLAVPGGIDVAGAAGSKGDIAVTTSGLRNTGEFIVGDAGLGTLSIRSGGTVLTTPGSVSGVAGLVIANAAGAAGSSVEVSGIGSLLNVTGLVDVGAAGSGSMQLSGGATIAAGSLDSGDIATGVGQINVTGAGTGLNVAGSLVVGDAGVGRLSISQGASVSAASLDAAAAAGGGGAISLSGAGSALNVSGTLSVGDRSSGSLNIANGAIVTASGLIIGSGATGSGNVVIGPGSHLNLTGTVINVGLAGSGVLDVQGGTLGLVAGTTLSPGTFGRIVQVGGLIDPAAVFDASGGSFGGGGTAEASVDILNTSLATVSGLAETLLAPLITSGDTLNLAGVWSIKSSGTLVLDANTVDNSQTIQFGDTTGELVIGQQVTLDATQTPVPIAASALSGFQAPIVGYKAGDVIAFSGLTVASDSVTGNVVTLFDSRHDSLGSLTFQSAKGGADNAGAAAAAAQIVPCFAAGTLIETVSGPRAVEELASGDLVVTHDGMCEPIVWMGQRVVDCARHPKPETVWPVRVRTGAFGANVPVRDLFLSPDHAVFVNGVLVPIKLLINDASIIQAERDSVVYYHVELPEHAVILAEGLPVESYLDVGDRATFDGCTIIRLFPDFTARLAPETTMSWETRGAAPLVMTGEELARARAFVAANATRGNLSFVRWAAGSQRRREPAAAISASLRLRSVMPA